MWGFTPSHFPTLPGICDVTPGLSLNPHPCNPFALVGSLKAKVTTFYVDLKVYVVENNCNLDIINSSVKNLDNSHVIIQALNTTYLRQHYKYINYDHNFQMFHILCLIKTKIHHGSTDVHKFINSSKYSYISIHEVMG